VGTHAAETIGVRRSTDPVDVVAGGGDDTIQAPDTADRIDAGAGDDTIDGGYDTIDGGYGDDTIVAGPGARRGDGRPRHRRLRAAVVHLPLRQRHGRRP
jgi:hypothetical protein